MTKVFFVRHAKPVINEDDRNRPLTNEGIADTALVLETLKDKKIDAFYCSPYKRSVQTIESTARYFNMKIITDERLRERESGGIWNNGDALQKRWEDFDYHEKNGESIGSVQSRNVEALKEILSKNEGKTVVIGTHGTALSSIFNYYDPSFGAADFLRIVNWMPYIVECNFDGGHLSSKKEIAYIDKLKKSAIIVVPMTTEDEIRGKAYVHFKSWHESYTGLVGEDYLNNKVTLEKCLSMAQKFSENVLIAKDGERVVGFAAYGKYRGDDLKIFGEIYAIYVLEEYQKKRVGLSLMNAAIDKLRDYKKVALWVFKENKKAIDFYEKYGFVPDGAENVFSLGTELEEIRLIYDNKGRIV